MTVPVLNTMQVIHEDDITFVQISPKDSNNHDHWITQLCKDLHEKTVNSSHIVIDMTSLEYLYNEIRDALMLKYHQKVQEGRLILVGTQDDVLAQLKCVNLDRIFEFAETDSEAVNMINGH